MPKRVSKKVALALRDVGYPQEIGVGEYGYHPWADLVRCTKSEASPPGTIPNDDPVLKAPTYLEASAWCRLNGVNYTSLIDVVREFY